MQREPKAWRTSGPLPRISYVYHLSAQQLSASFFEQSAMENIFRNLFSNFKQENYFCRIFSRYLMKEKIIETSLQLFLTDGIRNMTVQKLVLQLGISTKTMYKHFKNKEELVEECLKVHYGTSANEIKNLLEGSANPVVSLARLYSKAIEMDFGTSHIFYHDLNYYYPDVQDKVIKHYTSGALAIVNGLIQQGLDEGYYLNYLKAPIIQETLTVLYRSVTRSEVYKTFSMKRELVKHTILVYLRGICTHKGLKIINELKEFS
jgi:AcrR family transcriptional regulator